MKDHKEVGSAGASPTDNQSSHFNNFKKNNTRIHDIYKRNVNKMMV